jgi:xylan 1,4-beta-xylosidase
MVSATQETFRGGREQVAKRRSAGADSGGAGRKELPPKQGLRGMKVNASHPGRIDFDCDLSAKTTPFPHFWEHTVGGDHAPMALRADYRAQLRRCHDELGFRHARFHGLLSDDMGTLICHKEKYLYSFFNADQIWDFLLGIGMKPFVELSFMPRILASGSTTVFRYKGNVTPPKDYKRWATLIRKLAAHWIDRYGIAEVRTWFFEVWNEPNLRAFWTGTQKDYFNLYRYTVRALKDVDNRLRVGGPVTAKNQWIEEFVVFCEKNDLPADFISTHSYPTDVVKGTSLGDEKDATEAQLARSPRSIMRQWAQDVHRLAGGRPVYYTEWNTSSNPRDPRHDEPYAAAFVTKTVMEASGLVDGYSFWTFSDIFAEDYFPSVPFHGGFGLLNLHGIAKPTYRAFELLHRLGTEQLRVLGVHLTVDAWAVRGKAGVTILLTNCALPRHPIGKEHVRIRLTDAPQPQDISLERIDEEHANPKTLWLEMGKPTYLSAKQVEQLQSDSRIVREQQPWKYEQGAIHLDIDLPPQSVAAVTVRFSPQTHEGGQP